MSIFFLKLDFYSIFPALFYRVIRFKVYFLECDDIWRRQQFFLFFSKIGINWISHQLEVKLRSGAVTNDCYVESMRIGKRLTTLPIYERLSKVLRDEESLKFVVCGNLLGTLSGPIELLHCIQGHQSQHENERVFAWFPNTLVTQCLLESYPEIINKCPRSLSYFEEICKIGVRTLNALWKGGRATLGKIHFFSLEDKSTDFSASGKNLNFQNIRVAFFPHQGVFYSNLYVKDHFYSPELASPFHCSKIAHFELDGFRPTNCENYYKKKNISNFDWNSISVSKLHMIKLLTVYLMTELRYLFLHADWNLLVRFSIIYWAINYAKLRLLRLPNLKVILIGYDILFPPALAYACRLTGIKTVAVQERMIATWWMPPLILDHYFIIGPAAREYMEKTFPPGISYHEVGPVRMKDHLKATCPREVYKLREEYSSIVLALDFHSEPGWYENGRKIANNWRNNAVFYDHLLKLCTDFPNACFLLKGKNYHFSEIPFFKQYILKFKDQHNLIILSDMNVWTPFNSVKAADIGFARQSSLADEMLALGKPVVFDDYDGFPSEIYNYGAQVTSHSYEDLRGKFRDYFTNPADYNFSLNELRSQLYTIPIESADVVVRTKLNEILCS